MSLAGDARNHVIECARDLREWEIPLDKLEEFARVMAKDETHSFVIIPRIELENVRDAVALYDRVRWPWWVRWWEGRAK